MIETQAQSVQALEYVIAYTKWSFREISRQSGIHYATISRIVNESDYMPQRETRKRLYDLLLKVKGMEAEANQDSK